MQILDRMITPGQPLSGNRQRFTNSMLKAMIVPLVIEQVLQLIVGLADTMMVSYAGEAIVAGVGLDTMVYTIFIYLFTAITAGGSVVAAQYLGSGKRDRGNLAASQICNQQVDGSSPSTSFHGNEKVSNADTFKAGKHHVQSLPEKQGDKNYVIHRSLQTSRTRAALLVFPGASFCDACVR